MHQPEHGQTPPAFAKKPRRQDATHRLDRASAPPVSAATAPPLCAVVDVLPLVGMTAPLLPIPAVLPEPVELGLMILEPNANCICCVRVGLKREGQTCAVVEEG